MTYTATVIHLSEQQRDAIATILARVIRRWDYALCVIAMAVFGFAIAYEEKNPFSGWIFFTVFVCFPTALRSENLGFASISLLALFIPGLNIVFALECLAFPQDFTKTRKLDLAAILWIIVLTIIALLWGSLWYRQWHASQPLIQ